MTTKRRLCIYISLFCMHWGQLFSFWGGGGGRSEVGFGVGIVDMVGELVVGGVTI